VLAAIAGSPDYAALIEASRRMVVWVAVLVWLASWVRSGGSWPLALLALPLAAGVALVSLSHAGRPEQFVPAVCAVAWMLRAHPGLRRSAVGFGMEVGAVAFVSPAPAVILGLLYGWTLLTGSRGGWPALRMLRFAAAATASWVVLVGCFSPFDPWTVLVRTAEAYLGARDAAPHGLTVGLRMLATHPDVPMVGGAWLLFAAYAVHASWRAAHAEGGSRWLALVVLAVLGSTIAILGVRTYTAQYTFVSMHLALLSAVGALAVRGREDHGIVVALTAALSLPMLALWTAPPGARMFHGADLRRAAAPALAASAVPADSAVLSLESDAMLWLAESRPGRIVVGQSLSRAARTRIESALGRRLCWALTESPEAGLEPDLVETRWIADSGGRSLRLYRVAACEPGPQPPRAPPPA
jgi:hypothetical protein